MLTLLHSDLLLVSEDELIIQLFEPRNSPVCFAFLGAYFYGVNAILRGYVRRDLRPKMYSTLIVRIVVVVLLAWVFDVYLDGTPLLLAAFLAGLVPETALVLIKEAGRGALGYVGRQFDELEEHDPLTKLEGIDLYDRARLFDEGVTNVEGLAHHDLVELMLQTRIPIPRLVDWVDQAILYLHAGPYGGANAVHTRSTALETLREYGIRTATDLDRAFEAARRRKELESLLVDPSGQRTAGRLACGRSRMRSTTMSGWFSYATGAIRRASWSHHSICESLTWVSLQTVTRVRGTRGRGPARARSSPRSASRVAAQEAFRIGDVLRDPRRATPPPARPAPRDGTGRPRRCPSRNACVQTRLRASSTAPAGSVCV